MQFLSTRHRQIIPLCNTSDWLTVEINTVSPLISFTTTLFIFSHSEELILPTHRWSPLLLCLSLKTSSKCWLPSNLPTINTMSNKQEYLALSKGGDCFRRRFSVRMVQMVSTSKLHFHEKQRHYLTNHLMIYFCSWIGFLHSIYFCANKLGQVKRACSRILLFPGRGVGLTPKLHLYTFSANLPYYCSIATERSLFRRNKNCSYPPATFVFKFSWKLSTYINHQKKKHCHKVTEEKN